MGKILKQTIQGSIFSYSGIILGFIITGVITPNIFTPEEVGLTRILNSYSLTFSLFASLGFNSASYRIFGFFRNNEQKHNGFLSLSLLINLIGFLIFCIGFLFFTDEIKGEFTQKYSTYIWLLIPLTFFNLYFSSFDATLTLVYKSVFGTFVKQLLWRLIYLVPICLFIFKIINFNQFVLQYSISLCLPAVVLFVKLVKDGEFNFKFQFKFISKDIWNNILIMSTFGIISGFASTAIQNIDSLMVNNMLGLSDTGIYSITMFFGSVIMAPSQQMKKITATIIAEAWKVNDIKLISTIYCKSSLTQYIIGLLIFIGIWANIDNVFHILTNDYSKGKYVIFFIALGNVLEMSAGISSVVISNSKYYKMLTFITIIFGLSVILLNYLLIPIFGMVGAALASLGATIIYVFLRYFYVLRICKSQPYNLKFLQVTAIAAVAYYISYLIPAIETHFILDIAMRSSLITIVFVSGIYLLKVSDDVNGLMNKYIRIAKNKLTRKK